MQHTPCKNCRHFINDCPLPFTLKHGKCGLTRMETPAKVDLVDGKMLPAKVEYLFASTARGEYGDCGKVGKLFERETDYIKLFRNRYAAPLYGTGKAIAIVTAYYLLWKWIAP